MPPTERKRETVQVSAGGLNGAGWEVKPITHPHSMILIMSEAENSIPAVEPGGKETNLGVHRAFQSVVRNPSECCCCCCFFSLEIKLLTMGLSPLSFSKSWTKCYHHYHNQHHQHHLAGLLSCHIIRFCCSFHYFNSPGQSY